MTVTGVKVRPPLASFRDSGTSTSVAEVTELHKLWNRHRSLSLPREPSPPELEDQSDLAFDGSPVFSKDCTELSTQNTTLQSDDQSEVVCEPASPCHSPTNLPELPCDYDTAPLDGDQSGLAEEPCTSTPEDQQEDMCEGGAVDTEDLVE